MGQERIERMLAELLGVEEGELLRLRTPRRGDNGARLDTAFAGQVVSLAQETLGAEEITGVVETLSNNGHALTAARSI